MSDLTRHEVQVIAESLGRAFQALSSPLGDTDRHPTALLEAETALCRLRGSTLFHDTDYARSYLHFNGEDTVGLGIQGAYLDAPAQAAQDFPPIPLSTPWDPEYYGPPSTEGWDYWQYNGWMNWRPSPLTTNFEPSSGSGRLAFNYPVRYSGGSYSRVAFWEHARWISVLNTSGSTITSGNARVTFTLSETDLIGLRVTDPANGDKPVDLRFQTHARLVQAGTIGSWTAIPVLPLTGDLLIDVPYDLVKNGTGWDVSLNVPAALDPWTNNKWWHLVFYWGSTDPTSIAGLGSYVGSQPLISAANAYLWPRKSFFDTAITTHLTWDPANINNSQPSLVARKRTHFAFLDGQYSAPTVPVKYDLSATWPAAPTDGITNSLTNYVVEIPAGCAVPVLLCAHTESIDFGAAQTTLMVVTGPTVTPEFWPAEPNGWAASPYFPPTPVDYVAVARAVLVRAPGETYGVREETSFNPIFIIDFPYIFGNFVVANTAIAWLERSVLSHAVPPLGDSTLAARLLPPLHDLLFRLRNLGPGNPVSQAAFTLLVPGARVPGFLAPSRADLTNATGRASTIFRGLLKTPVATALQPAPGEPLAISFEAPARELITDLAGLPPSTELLRLDSDHLHLSGARFKTATTLELYHEPSEQCTSVDSNTPGTRLGQDYTFRLVLEDANENTFLKDWYIMASRYLITQDELDRRVLQQQSTAGYYTETTLKQASSQFRLYNYAGLVHDLSMGLFRTLTTRVVSPPDGSKITEAQFVAALGCQPHCTDQQISDVVLAYLEAGGEFYTIDLSQYPNQFVALRSAGIAVTTYGFGDVLYWTNTLFRSAFSGELSIEGGSPPAFNSLRADSFTVAQTGLVAGVLERYGTQADVVIDHTSATGTDRAFTDSLSWGLKIAANSSDRDIYDVGFHFKIAPAVGNSTGHLFNGNSGELELAVYEDDGFGKPGATVTLGSAILLSTIGLTYAEYRIRLSARLLADITYWLVLTLSETPDGGDLIVETATSGSDEIAYLDEDAVWQFNAPNARAWLQAYALHPKVLGHFNRDTYGLTEFLPPPNRERVNAPLYEVDGFWAYTGDPLSTPATLTLYPRAAYDTGSSSWRYVKFAHDIFVVARFTSGGRIITETATFTAATADSDPDPTPITLGSIEADELVYLAIGKTAEALNTPTHGAPPGDRLIIRSA